MYLYNNNHFRKPITRRILREIHEGESRRQCAEGCRVRTDVRARVDVPFYKAKSARGPAAADLVVAAVRLLFPYRLDRISTHLPVCSDEQQKRTSTYTRTHDEN